MSTTDDALDDAVDEALEDDWGDYADPDAAFSEDLDDLLAAPDGFELVQTFRGAVADVKPLLARGCIEVRFRIDTLDITQFAPLIAASGRILEIGVAKKVWRRDP